MLSKLVGSDLTRAMLERGDQQVWCAVSNESEQDAINTIKNVDGKDLYLWKREIQYYQ